MFSRLVGNSSIAERLQYFLLKGRVPNALLFAGTDGVGKRQFALELAKSMICSDASEHGSCGECSACRRVDVIEGPPADAKGDDYDAVFFTEHPDVGVVLPFNRNLRVGSIRQLEVEANFLPFEARARIFIVDDADKMNASASNALLKTLEEPPPTSHIFLITSKPDSLLPTIRSRCQVLRFAPVETAEIERFLLKMHQYSQEDARLAAVCSQGSIAKAVSFEIDEIRGRRETALDVLKNAVLYRDLISLLRLSETVTDAKNKANFEDFLDVLQSLIRDIWAIVYREPLLENPDLRDEIGQLAAAVEPGAPAAWLAEIEAIRASLFVNVNRRIAVDALLTRMAIAARP